MNINLLFEILIILFAILLSNGIIYSLSIYYVKKINSSDKISVIRNSSDSPFPMLLIASNPVNITPSESDVSEILSITSSDTFVSEILSVSSSDTNVSSEIFDPSNLSDIEINEGITTINQDSLLLNTNEDIIPSDFEFYSLDSLTVLNRETFEQWLELVKDLHDHPINSPANVLQQIKFEELNILYSQDIIHYAITQSELRLIIELIPAMDLFKPDINHLILTIMAYFHL